MSEEISVRDETLELLSQLNLTELEAKDLEIGIYNSTIDYCSDNSIPLTWSNDLFREAYLAKARSMYSNLKADSYIGNKNLCNRLKDREFLPHELPFKPRETLHPEAWRSIIDLEMTRNKNAYEMNEVAMTDQLQCGKCKKFKVSYFEKQCRSADEPQTIFASCLVCGYRWTM